MNVVILVGRLTKPPGTKYTQQGVGVTNLTLAVDRAFKNAQGEKEADFINCVAFDRSNYKLAEYLGNDLQKGQQVTIRGCLRVRTYDNADGKKVWITEVIIEEARYAKQGQAHANEGGNHPDDSDQIPF